MSNIDTIIFDLSEVFISGLYGVERPLSNELGLTEIEVFKGLGRKSFFEAMRGKLSEDQYIKNVIKAQEWEIEPERVKELIRENLHREVSGSIALLSQLDPSIKLVLLSDHIREWVDYLKGVHPFLGRFDHLFFSYEFGNLKHNPKTFRRVLTEINKPASQCVFVDDNLGNVHIAERVGIESIHFRDSEQLSIDLKSRRLIG